MAWVWKQITSAVLGLLVVVGATTTKGFSDYTKAKYKKNIGVYEEGKLYLYHGNTIYQGANGIDVSHRSHSSHSSHSSHASHSSHSSHYSSTTPSPSYPTPAPVPNVTPPPTKTTNDDCQTNVDNVLNQNKYSSLPYNLREKVHGYALKRLNCSTDSESDIIKFIDETSVTIMSVLEVGGYGLPKAGSKDERFMIYGLKLGETKRSVTAKFDDKNIYAQGNFTSRDEQHSIIWYQEPLSNDKCSSGFVLTFYKDKLVSIQCDNYIDSESELFRYIDEIKEDGGTYHSSYTRPSYESKSPNSFDKSYSWYYSNVSIILGTFLSDDSKYKASIIYRIPILGDVVVEEANKAYNEEKPLNR